MSSETPYLKAVKAWLDGGMRIDTPTLLALTSEDFVLEVHPRSAGIPDTFGRAALGTAMEVAGKTFKDGVNKKEIVQIFEAAEVGKVVAQLKSVNTFTADGKPYENEFLYIIDMVLEDGVWKVGHVLEFMDSALIQRLHGVRSG